MRGARAILAATLAIALGGAISACDGSKPLIPHKDEEEEKIGPFPAADRPVAHVVSARWSNEDERDRLARGGSGHGPGEIRPGMTVADIGAGEGYYTVRLAQRVGKNGRVLAEDIVAAGATSWPSVSRAKGWTMSASAWDCPPIPSCRPTASTGCSWCTCIMRSSSLMSSSGGCSRAEARRAGRGGRRQPPHPRARHAARAPEMRVRGGRLHPGVDAEHALGGRLSGDLPRHRPAPRAQCDPAVPDEGQLGRPWRATRPSSLLSENPGRAIDEKSSRR